VQPLDAGGSYNEPDIALLVGGQKFLAHKAALSKVSENFEELLATAEVQPDAISKATGMLALDLRGICETEAVKLVLRQVYKPSTVYRPTSEEVNRQALALAVGFEMQGICEIISQWMITQVTESNVEERMDVSDEMGLPDLTAAITSQLALNKNNTPRKSLAEGDTQTKPMKRKRMPYTEEDRQAAPPFIAKLMDAADQNTNLAGGSSKWKTTMAAAKALAPERHRSALEAIPFKLNTPGIHAKALDEFIRNILDGGFPADGDVPSVKTADAPTAKPAVGQTRPKRQTPAASEPAVLDVEEILKRVEMHTASFSDKGVPCSLALTEALPKRQLKLAEELQRLFEARPAWLPARLQEELGLSSETAALAKLLPYFAYRWVDGPWQGTYARLGWDPRQSAADARDLQVVKFSDPYFQTMEYHMSEVVDAGGPVDCHFRRPPSAKAQLYQLIDIEDPDGFLQSVLEGDPNGEVCSKKSGWLMDVSFQTVRDRLCVMCQKMREDEAGQANPGKRQRRVRMLA